MIHLSLELALNDINVLELKNLWDLNEYELLLLRELKYENSFYQYFFYYLRDELEELLILEPYKMGLSDLKYTFLTLGSILKEGDNESNPLNILNRFSYEDQKNYIENIIQMHNVLIEIGKMHYDIVNTFFAEKFSIFKINIKLGKLNRVIDSHREILEQFIDLFSGVKKMNSMVFKDIRKNEIIEKENQGVGFVEFYDKTKCIFTSENRDILIFLIVFLRISNIRDDQLCLLSILSFFENNKHLNRDEGIYIQEGFYKEEISKEIERILSKSKGMILGRLSRGYNSSFLNIMVEELMEAFNGLHFISEFDGINREILKKKVYKLLIELDNKLIANSRKEDM